MSLRTVVQRRLDSVLRAAYLQARGLPLGESVPTGVLVAEAGAKAMHVARGGVRKRRYGASGKQHFRAAAVRVTTPKQLTVGSWVVFNEGAVLSCFSSMGIQLGDRTTVGARAQLLASGVIRDPGVGIVIGARTAIGMGNLIWGQGGVKIGNDCLFGPAVTVISENHRFSAPGLIREQGVERAPVLIEDDVWIGANATILSGVRIGKGAIVAAGAVVVSDVSKGSIVGGVPARVIGNRVEDPEEPEWPAAEIH